MKSLLLLILVATLVVSFSGCGTTASQSAKTPAVQSTPLLPGQSAQTPTVQSATGSTAGAVLQILSDTWERKYNNITVSGQVKNIGKEGQRDVAAVATFFTADGKFVKSAQGLIDGNPILPGQTSPFSMFATDDPLITNYKIYFIYLSGNVIPSTK